jgi:CDP-diacylglycerol--glycerol-3-phosphate 3-phosphatidyltransferase/cardiolipin synthase
MTSADKSFGGTVPGTPGRGRMLSLPNLLTLSRIVALPLLAFLLWWPGWEFGYGLAFALYCAMGITDYFDGYLARASGAVSRLGVFLDPIADKIMVATVILTLAAQGILRGPYVGDAHVIAGLIILVREIAVSGLREFLGGLQVSIPVSKLAKWKTTFQLVSLGALILGGAMPKWIVVANGIAMNVPHTVGLTTVWGAAILTLVTGWDYLRVGLKHMD